MSLKMSAINDSETDEPTVVTRCDDGENGPPLWKSVRLRICFLCSAGFALVYALRVNLSIAIVAMVRETSHEFVNNDTICALPSPSNNSNSDGQFDWDSEVQGYVLGAFFYGYMATQIIGGWLADRYGARLLLSVGIFCTSFFTLFTEVAAHWGAEWLIALRILEGLGEGVTFPAAASFWARWSPPNERARMLGFCFAGAQLGTVIAIPLTGLIIELSGWPAVFYSFGGVGCFWCLLFYLYARNSPSEFVGISEGEKNYLLRTQQMSSKMPPVPWLALLKSAPLWAILVGHTTYNWGFYVLFTCLPKYLKEVLGFDMRHNALYSALPYLIMWISINITTQVGDHLIASGKCSKLTVRKVMQVLCEVPPAICLGLIPFFGCNKFAVIALICLCCCFNACSYCAYNVNHADLAPSFTGLLFGITNTVANAPGFLAPEMVGAFTKDESTIATWSRVWYTTAAIYVAGAIFYVAFAKAELQPWARDKHRRRTRSNEDTRPLLAADS